MSTQDLISRKKILELEKILMANTDGVNIITDQGKKNIF